MRVSEIMTETVKTVTPITPLIEVVSMMCLYRFSTLPVEENGKLVGIVAEKDILARLLPDIDDMMDGKNGINYDVLMQDYTGIIRLLRVSDMMSSSVISVTPDMHILEAAALMTSKRLRLIPVTERKHLAGILSLGDVHKAIFHRSISSSLWAA